MESWRGFLDWTGATRGRGRGGENAEEKEKNEMNGGKKKGEVENLATSSREP